MGLTSQKHQVESLNVRRSNKASETIYFLYQSGIKPPLSDLYNKIVNFLLYNSRQKIHLQKSTAISVSAYHNMHTLMTSRIQGGMTQPQGPSHLAV